MFVLHENPKFIHIQTFHCTKLLRHTHSSTFRKGLLTDTSRTPAARHLHTQPHNSSAFHATWKPFLLYRTFTWTNYDLPEIYYTIHNLKSASRKWLFSWLGSGLILLMNSSDSHWFKDDFLVYFSSAFFERPNDKSYRFISTFPQSQFLS